MSVQKIKLTNNQALAVVICVAAFWALAAPAGATTNVTIRYERTLRLPLSVHGVGRPVAVTHEAGAGETCITDARSPALQLVNRHGVAIFETTRFAALSTPLDACLDADGIFVFIDRPLGSPTRIIRHLNLHGEPLDYDCERPNRDWSPNHLIICRNGDYLTLDGDQGLLARHDARTGALLWQRRLTGDESDTLFLGRPGEGSDGTLYVPGGELHAVLVLTAEGELTGRFGEFGTGPGKMIFPVAVAAGPGDTILVLDRMRHKIMVHDSGQNLLSEFGSVGTAPGQFYHPVDIAITASGSLYVAQGFEGRVQVFQLAVDGRP